MIQPVILEKLAELPESLQTEVLHYIEFLIEKQAKNLSQEKPTKRGGLGISPPFLLKSRSPTLEC